MFFFFIPALIITLLLEGTITTLPLVLVVLLCLTIIRRDAMVFPVAFIAGFVLDVMAIRTLGTSSIFFTVMLFLILLYQRKYEINSYPFVGAAAFLGSLGYLVILGYQSWFIQSVLSGIVALSLFMTLRFFYKGLKSQNSNLKFTSQMSKF